MRDPNKGRKRKIPDHDAPEPGSDLADSATPSSKKTCGELAIGTTTLKQTGDVKVPALAGVPSKNRLLKPNRKTPAAKWNSQMMSGLEAELLKNPEADIITLLGPRYSQRLKSFKGNRNTNPARAFPAKDIRSILCVTDEATVLSELEPEVTSLLHNGDCLSEAIVYLLANSEVLYEGVSAASVMVFRVNEGIALKVTHSRSLVTEYASLAYLEEHLPSFPTPGPLGLIKFGIFYLLFTTLVPGLTLEKAWPSLAEDQKHSISTQLDKLFSDLRSLPFPENTPLGSVTGAGCIDGRQRVRTNAEPILNVAQFEDFIFFASKGATPVYINFLRSLIPTYPQKCVFTHGDLRPANIIVRQSDTTWNVVGVVDWERSGFYPEYWEAVKMTNNLFPGDRFDWYEYLPRCVSAIQYPIHWLVDRVWDANMENS